MRPSILICGFLAMSLSGCAPKGDPQARSREVRRYPSATLGTENWESQTYRTQTIAAPSAETAAAALVAPPAAHEPARVLKTPTRTRKHASQETSTGAPATSQ